MFLKDLFSKAARTAAMGVGVTAVVMTTAASADTTQTAVDFGMAGDNCGPSPVYAGTFDGTSGFVGMEIGNCGDQVDVSVDIGGGATFSFTNVTGWNNSDTGDVNDVRALTGDHFFSNWEGSGPVSFSLDGFDPTDIVILELLDRRGGESALVTFNGVDTLVSSDALGEFTDVSGGGVTGSSSYGGSFTGPNGDGEGNLAGARITIIRNDGGGGPCPGDFDGNGTVNGADFGVLLASWGSCPACPADLDGDGLVSGADLGVMLSRWGPCP